MFVCVCVSVYMCMDMEMDMCVDMCIGMHMDASEVSRMMFWPWPTRILSVKGTISFDVINWRSTVGR